MSGTVGGKRKAKLADWAVGLIVVGLFALSFFAAGGNPLDEFEGDEAPAFTLPALGGGETSLGDLRGKVVVLDFWATWCTPCFQQMPKLREARDIVGEEHVVIVSINVDSQPANREQKMENFLKRARADWGTLVDDGTVQRMYNANSLPTLVIIDPRGVVKFTGVGVHSSESLVREIEAARGGADG